jgi:hypothetical protein
MKHGKSPTFAQRLMIKAAGLEEPEAKGRCEWLVIKNLPQVLHVSNGKEVKIISKARRAS